MNTEIGIAGPKPTKCAECAALSSLGCKELTADLVDDLCVAVRAEVDCKGDECKRVAEISGNAVEAVSASAIARKHEAMTAPTSFLQTT